MTNNTKDQPADDSDGKAPKDVSVAASIRSGKHAINNVIGQKPIDTGGGAFIGGSVSMGGGTFVGRDQSNVTYQQGASLPELQSLVAELGRLLRQEKLPAEIGETVEGEFETVEQQIAEDKPNGTIVKSRLSSLKELLSGADAAAGSVEKILTVVGKAVQLAGLLFP